MCVVAIVLWVVDECSIQALHCLPQWCHMDDLPGSQRPQLADRQTGGHQSTASNTSQCFMVPHMRTGRGSCMRANAARCERAGRGRLALHCVVGSIIETVPASTKRKKLYKTGFVFTISDQTNASVAPPKRADSDAHRNAARCRRRWCRLTPRASVRPPAIQAGRRAPATSIQIPAALAPNNGQRVRSGVNGCT
jgi:hypothetical protein